MKSITVYGTKTCEFCKLAREYLRAKHLDFTDVDVNENAKAAEEMIIKSGQTATPVIDIDGTIIVGFQKDMLDGILAL